MFSDSIWIAFADKEVTRMTVVVGMSTLHRTARR
jgi:hypothetical protein